MEIEFFKTLAKFFGRDFFNMTYTLNDHEKELWDSIEKKAKIGYDEWFAKTKGDDLCGPWIKDYTKEENDLIDKIHHQLYGEDWWIAMPIHTAQVNYVMYEDIKDRLIWKDH